MGYLVLNDYFSTIQGTYFTQLTQGNDANRLVQENTAQTEIISYLVTRYDVSTEFANTTVYSQSAIYKANALVQLNGSAWVIAQYNVNAIVTFNSQVYLCIAQTDAAWVSQNYTVNQQVYYTDGNYYKCILDTVSNEIPTNATYWVKIATENPTNNTYWKSLGNVNDLWYLAYPYPVFDVMCDYNIGDKVYWKGNIYECAISTVQNGHFNQLQNRTVRTVNNNNQFPDATNQTQWSVGVAYGVTGIYPGTTASAYNPGTTYSIGNLCTVGTQLWQSLTNNNLGNTPGSDIINWQQIIWTFGDNRNAQLVRYMVYMVIWYLSPTLAPMNVPQVWRKNYDTAIDWLMAATKGDVIVDLPKVTPPTGKRITYGGNVKQINDYT